MARINLKTAAKKARALRRKHPSMKWTTAMRDSMRSLSKKRKRVGAQVKKKRAKKPRAAVIRKIKRAHATEGRALRSLGSIASNIARAKKLLEEKIAWHQMRLIRPLNANSRRRTLKHIAELKARYRKLL